MKDCYSKQGNDLFCVVFSTCGSKENENGISIQLKTQLSGMFPMKDLGPAENCLGIRVNYLKNGIADCEPVATAMKSSIKLTKKM